MTPDQERAGVLRARAESWREDGLISAESERAIAGELAVPWRSFGVLAQVVLFLLTALGIAAFAWFLDEVGLEAAWIVAPVCIALSELLIRRYRWLGTGVEGALFLGGLFALIFALPGESKPEALLLFAAACAIAAVRVRNPIFGAAGAVFVAAYAEKRFDLGVVVALLLASVAVIALLRTWRRPSTEWLAIAIALVLPVAGYTMADQRWRTTTIALYALFGAAALVLGIVKRHHALLFAGAIGLTIATIEIGRMLDTPIELKLGVGGAFLLALSWIVARRLRERNAGIVVTPARLTTADELIEMAGTVTAAQHAQPEAPPEPSAARPQGEGGFGGGGATGSY